MLDDPLTNSAEVKFTGRRTSSESPSSERANPMRIFKGPVKPRGTVPLLLPASRVIRKTNLAPSRIMKTGCSKDAPLLGTMGASCKPGDHLTVFLTSTDAAQELQPPPPPPPPPQSCEDCSTFVHSCKLPSGNDANATKICNGNRALLQHLPPLTMNILLHKPFRTRRSMSYGILYTD